MLTQPVSILKRILTVSVIAVSTSGTVAMPTAIASDIKQACESLSGTYHSLDSENWMCLYKTPNHNQSLGIHCNQNRQCNRLVYSRHSDDSLTLEWIPIVSSTQIDD